MRFPVFSASVNPAIDLPLLRKKRSYVVALLTNGTAVLIDPKNFKAGVQLLAKPRPESIVESIGLSNLIPFSRTQNRLLKPDSINYPIPMSGDRTCFARHRRLLIRVSGRSQFASATA